MRLLSARAGCCAVAPLHRSRNLTLLSRAISTTSRSLASPPLHPPPAPAPFYTLGLDVNTHSIGYALLCPSLHLVSSGLILPPPSLPPPTRLAHVRSHLSSLLASLPPSFSLLPACESYLRSFATARFHLASLFTLAEWNVLTCYALYEATGTWPLRIHPNTARAMWGLKKTKTPSGAGKDIKQVAWEFVQERVRREAEAGLGPGVEWVRKANGEVHRDQYDISDAYIIALTAATQRLSSPLAAETAVAVQATEEAEASGVRKVRRVRAKVAADAALLASALTGAVAVKRRVRKKAELLMADPVTLS